MMHTVFALFRRNLRLFFKDKGMFFTSLITPVILLVLFVAFLGGIYRDSFMSMIPDSFLIDDMQLNGIVGGQLVSSLLSVSCVTVSFCANLLPVQDKVNGTRRDLVIAPIPHSALTIAYFAAGFVAALIICSFALAAGLVYLSIVGWYVTAADAALMFAAVVMMTLFGTSLSAVIGHFLSSQGQMAAVSTVISTGYGYVSGAYMPLSQFGEGLQQLLACFPGTYGTVLLRRYAVNGALSSLQQSGIPEASVKQIRDALDCNLYFHGMQIADAMLWLVPAASAAVLIAAVILLNRRKTA